MRASDVASFQKWLVDRRNRRTGKLLNLVFGVSLGWVVVAATVTPVGRIGAAILVICWVLLSLRLRSGKRGTAAWYREFAERNSGTLVAEIAGVRYEHAMSRSFIAWASIVDVAETPEFIYLMSTSLSGLIIPRRCFADPGRAQAFFDFADGHVGDLQALQP